MSALRAFVLATIAASASATTLPQLPIEQLFKQADTVAIITIAEGHTLGNGEQNCGAVYNARVEQLFKGRRVGSIELGYFVGTAIGNQYLVFLTAPKREYNPVTSATSGLAEEELKYQERCAGQQSSANRIMHGGLGIMEIGWGNWTDREGPEEDVFVPSAYVKFPDTLKQTKATFGRHPAESKVVWIKKGDVVQYLLQLAERN